MQNKISQKKLAEGIISVVQLSRAEYGHYELTEEEAAALFERLGFEELYGSEISNEDERKIASLKKKVTNYLCIHDYETAASLIAKMEANPEFNDNGLNHQFLLRSKAMLCLSMNKDIGLVRTYLDEAIKYSIPNFAENKVHTYMLKSEDIEVIGMYADLYYRDNMHEKALTLQERLIIGIKKNTYDEDEVARALVLALYNLALYHEYFKSFKKAILACDEALEIGRENMIYGQIPYIMANKAFFHFKLKDAAKGKECYLQAYYTFLAFGFESAAAGLKDFVHREHGYHLC